MPSVSRRLATAVDGREQESDGFLALFAHRLVHCRKWRVGRLGEFDVVGNSGYTPVGAPAVGYTQAIFAYNELDTSITRGLTAQLKYDYEDPNTTIEDDQRHRATIGLQVDPYNHTQVLVQYRKSFLKNKSASADEAIVMVHLWL